MIPRRRRLSAALSAGRTLTLVRLDESAEPVWASETCRPINQDVLLAATVCWRNDVPEGFIFRGVFQNRRQGEAFVARYQAQRAILEAAKPTKDAI